ncbi:MAG: DUF2169 domain-containing protein [Byssovorax sp.]
MFLRNKTRYRVGLARTFVNDALSVATAVVVSHYRIEPDRLVWLEEPSSRTAASPPDPLAFPLWKGVSVTASGYALGPLRAPFIRAITLSVGAEVRRLSVFGERRWQQGRAGDLVVSEPESFDAIPVVFARAFGGAYDVPPGLFPGTDLPFPGLRVAHSSNPSGLGFYETPGAALNCSLPNVESPTALIRVWDDRPEPAGFAPCPELPNLRAPTDLAAYREIAAISRARAKGSWEQSAAELQFELTLRMIHHAPGRLIFDKIPRGTVASIDGLGDRALCFSVPPSPVRVERHGAKRNVEVPPVLRAIHVDGDGRIVELVHGHMFYYAPDQAPAWVRVIERGSS